MTGHGRRVHRRTRLAVQRSRAALTSRRPAAVAASPR